MLSHVQVVTESGSHTMYTTAYVLSHLRTIGVPYKTTVPPDETVLLPVFHSWKFYLVEFFKVLLGKLDFGHHSQNRVL